MERKGTNIVFNYKIQETQSVPIKEVQAGTVPKGQYIEQRPASIPSQNANNLPGQTQNKPQVQEKNL